MSTQRIMLVALLLLVAAGAYVWKEQSMTPVVKPVPPPKEKKHKIADALDAQDKQETREHILERVKVESSNQVRKLGGIRRAEITVLNTAKYELDLVIVEIAYKKPNGQVLDTEKLIFKNLKPLQAMSMFAPDSKRGHSITCQVVEVKSEALGL